MLNKSYTQSFEIFVIQDFLNKIQEDLFIFHETPEESSV